MEILFAGSKDRGALCLEHLLDAGAKILGVVTEDENDPDSFWDRSVKETAIENGLDLYNPEDVNGTDFRNEIDSLGPDLMVLSGFSQIIGPEILGIPKKGVINLHAGKLPHYRGGSPMNWAIINGERRGTATIHHAAERVDAGDILAEREFPIGLNDTIEDVRQKTLDIFPQMLVDVVKELRNGTAEPKPVDVSDGTYWGSRRPQDGRINWERMTAKEVYDFIRALTHPYPGAFTTYQGERLYVWDAELLERTVKHGAGRICVAKNNGRVVAAKDRGVLLTRVQLAGQEEEDAINVIEQGRYLR